MDKRGILLFIAISILISGCSSKESNTMPPDVKVQNDDLKLGISEKDMLNEYLQLIEPILDYSIFSDINIFGGNIVNWATTKSDKNIDEAKHYYEKITAVLTEIIDKDFVSGYGIQTEWESLSKNCSRIRGSIERIMRAVEDNDPVSAVAEKGIYSNSDILKSALVIQNRIQQELNSMEVPLKEPLISKEEAQEILEEIIELLDGQYLGDGSVREIDGRDYYLFTISNENTVDGAYCIDVITGEVFYCEEDLNLIPVSID